MQWLKKAWEWVRGLVGLSSKNTPEPNSENRSSRTFYHGTQTAIHLLPNAYLDPKFSKGGDEGDPKRPHVFVTPSKLMAKIFALKAPNVTGINITKKGPLIVFSSEPKNLHGGWVYTCPENPEKPFEELIVRGWNTGKWVSYDKVPITKPEYVPSLEHLMQQENLQVYILKDGMDLKEWNEKCRDAAHGIGLEQFLAEEVRVGNARHFNAELDTAPALIHSRTDWSKEPRNQPGCQPCLERSH